MSNHSGSYMLNHVLEILEKRGVFKLVGKEATLDIIEDVVDMADDYDCNQGEILDGIGERLGICYQCLEYSDTLEYELCPKCNARLDRPQAVAQEEPGPASG